MKLGSDVVDKSVKTAPIVAAGFVMYNTVH